MTTQDYLMILGGGFAFGMIAGRLRFHLIATLVALLPFVILAVLFLSGCAQAQVDKVMDISIGQKPAISCPKLVMPPVGTDCLLDIQGDKVTANDCGDTLLRGYVRARSLLKPAAPSTTKP